jgi:hypothetical protein
MRSMPRASRRFSPAAILISMLLLALTIAGWRWIAAHPEDNPWAALSLDQPIGRATAGKLAALGGDEAHCHALLDAAGISYTALPTVGDGQCLADDRTVFVAGRNAPVLTPAGVGPSCAVSASMVLWMRDIVQPMAMRHLGRRVVRVEHLGSYNCRRIAGSASYSEHARGNAIDISAFVLSDGRRVVLKQDWDASDGRSAFLKGVRDGSCTLFATVLSPDYNAAHADHFHFDQADRMMGWRVCR